ncbi:DUF5615 family PIN-like protein [Dyella sp. C11]|uniref:DUF5615 family PIN-like protein n=1 Tax=Dyella sp. C11 TaxID=2126991 RepID=UPI000D648AFC|nr:DUF5615 family PIN-like protein [Dyella sp. C11]
MWRELEGSSNRSLPDEGSMESRACFLVDASFPPRAVELLRSAGAQVRTSSDTGLVGQTDDAHAAYAFDRKLSLLTCNPGFLDSHRFPPQHGPAIFVFHFGSGSLNDMRRAMRCLAPVLGSKRFAATSRVEATCNSWTEHHQRADGTQLQRNRRLWRGKMQEWVDDGCDGEPGYGT